jgi:hypothetical protein
VKPGGGFVFTFPPNGAGRTELFDAQEGLFSHDPRTMRALFASLGLAVTHDGSFPAYFSGSMGWVTHHVLAGRSAAGIC